MISHDPTYTDAAAANARRYRQHIEKSVELAHEEPAPVPPREGTLRNDASGLEEIWWRGGWWSPHCLPADGARCYVRAVRERDRQVEGRKSP